MVLLYIQYMKYYRYYYRMIFFYFDIVFIFTILKRHYQEALFVQLSPRL
jgi:hypothetical protein